MESLPRPRRSRRLSAALVAVAATAFVGIGAVGVYRYVDNYWLYRGFPPPREPAYVKTAGVQQTLYVPSRALAGRRQQVIVYLPPGYDQHPTQRYPVLYLLHGFPGRPLAFLETVRMGILLDSAVARGTTAGAILVMPFGSTGTFTDKEWANGVRRGDGWETFLARDVVSAIDSRYRTIPTAAGRAIAGLSEGGYGALNIALHHPDEFGLVESWSGYARADAVPSIFGRRPSLLAYNTPLAYLRHVATRLRRDHTFFWFYTGSKDPYLAQNRRFAALLERYRISHRFFVLPGGHTWRAWRDEAPAALSTFLTRSQHA